MSSESSLRDRPSAPRNFDPSGGWLKTTFARLLLCGLVGSTLVACGDPPPPPKPPPTDPDPEPPPPPPEPTCEAMKDHCKADADTVATIPEVDMTFTPPAGWEYAMLEEATVTQETETGAVLVLTSMTYEKASYKANPARTKLVTSLSELVEIDPPKKVSFKKPAKRKIADLQMTLWENEAKRNKKKGALLLLSTKVGDREIFGIGYAPEGDMKGTKAILGALETFKKAEAKDDGDKSDDKEDGKK